MPFVTEFDQRRAMGNVLLWAAEKSMRWKPSFNRPSSVDEETRRKEKKVMTYYPVPTSDSGESDDGSAPIILEKSRRFLPIALLFSTSALALSLIVLIVLVAWKARPSDSLCAESLSLWCESSESPQPKQML